VLHEFWFDIAAFRYLKGAYKKHRDILFSRACCDRTKGNGFKLKKVRFRLDMRIKILTVRVMKHRSWLPREMVDVPSPETFKVRLDRGLSNLSSGRSLFSLQEEFKELTVKCPFQPQLFHDSMSLWSVSLLSY